MPAYIMSGDAKTSENNTNMTIPTKTGAIAARNNKVLTFVIH